VDVAGPFEIVVLGKDADGTLYDGELTLSVVPAAALQTLTVSPANVRFSDMSVPELLMVKGNFEDGIQRDLTAAATGTTYTSQDPSIVTVDAAGQIAAQANGTTIIAVTHGTVTALVPVAVQMETDLAIQQTAAPSPVPRERTSPTPSRSPTWARPRRAKSRSRAGCPPTVCSLPPAVTAGAVSRPAGR
jgi:hypothetical protein